MFGRLNTLSLRNLPINVEQDDIIIDGLLLTRVFRRQLRTWLWLGPLVTGFLLLIALCLVPGSYTADVSVAIQQPTMPGGGLAAALTGVSSQGKVYLGFLKSRQAAQFVEDRVHLQQLYHLPSERKTLELLMKSVKVEDSATDGLVYIHLTLPAPPRFSFPSSLFVRNAPSSQEVKTTVAQAANTYAVALKKYYITSDTDQGSVLLRSAASEERRKRADYEAALERVLTFNREMRRVDPRSQPTSASETNETASGMGAMYTALAQVQADLEAAQAVRATRGDLTNKQLSDLPSIPVDDQLLADARTRVSRDQADYEETSRLFGPENPGVIRARTQLDVDQAALNRQISGVRARLTTPDIRTDEQIQGLFKRQALLEKEIADARQRLGLHRTLSGEFGRLQTEVAIRLEVLKATLAEGEKIRLDNAYAQNRMTIIDEAIPPINGDLGIAKMALLCFAPVFLLFLAAIARQYMHEAQASPRKAMPMVSSANGSSLGTAIDSQEITHTGTGTGKH